MQKLVPSGLLIGSIGILLLLVSQANQSMGLKLDESIDNMSVKFRLLDEWLEKKSLPSDSNALDKIRKWVRDKGASKKKARIAIQSMGLKPDNNDLVKIYEWVRVKRKSFFTDKGLKWAIDVMLTIEDTTDCSPDAILILEKVQPAITSGTFPASDTSPQYFKRAFSSSARKFFDFCEIECLVYCDGPIGEFEKRVYYEYLYDEFRGWIDRTEKAESNGEKMIYQSTNAMIMDALELLELSAYVKALEDPSVKLETERIVHNKKVQVDYVKVIDIYKKIMNRYFDQCPEFIRLFGEKFGLLDRALSVVEILSPQLLSIESVSGSRDGGYVAKLFWHKLCSTVKGSYEARLLSLEYWAEVPETRKENAQA